MTSPVEELVAMRDGVRLATDVYLPDEWVSGPVVLVRLPYGKRDPYVFLDACAPYFTDRGYGFVVQDVRGTGRSEGEALPYVHEVHDGYDTLEWIAASTWCDGSVGMFGDSYYGYTQWAALASRHPALKAMVPRMASVELPHGPGVDPSVYVTPGDSGPGLPVTKDGIGRPPSLGWALALSTIWSGQQDSDVDFDLALRPPLAIFESAFAKAGHRSLAFDRTVPVHQPDAVFPDGHPFDAPPIPILHTVGWFDPVAKRGMAAYEHLRQLPGWSQLQFLTADSVDHENYHLDDVPFTDDDLVDANADALARFLPRYLGQALDFFDAHLSGVPGAHPTPQVRWHLGHVGYRTAESWPPAGAAEQTLFLGDLAQAAGPGGVGALQPAPPIADGSISWIHDPDDPVVAVGDSLSMVFDFPDESATSRRPDVLVFDTAPVDVPMDLAGPAAVDLTVASTAESMDLFVHLLDVHPDGAVHRLVGDQVTAALHGRHRHVRVDLGHLGYRVLPGHRLRLHVASSETPGFLVHPGTDENRWTASRLLPSTQTLVTAQDAPSRLVLTVLAGDDQTHRRPTTTHRSEHDAGSGGGARPPRRARGAGAADGGHRGHQGDAPAVHPQAGRP